MRPSATGRSYLDTSDMVINRDRSAGAIDVRFGAHYGLKSHIAPSPLRAISGSELRLARGGPIDETMLGLETGTTPAHPSPKMQPA